MDEVFLFVLLVIQLEDVGSLQFFFSCRVKMDAEKATVALKEVKANFGLNKNKTVSYFLPHSYFTDVFDVLLVLHWNSNPVEHAFWQKKIEFF